MKPFDLEAAKNGAKLITRDGRPARIVCWDRKDEDYPLCALLEDKEGHEQYYSYTKNGRIYLEGEDEFDLFMAPTKHEGWVNVYKSNQRRCCGAIYATKEEADVEACTTRIACAHIEWTE